MFYVDKATIETHWTAGVASVREHLGTNASGSDQFDSQQSAEEQARQNKRTQLQNEYNRLKKRFSSIEVIIFKIRALWNSRIRESLKAHQQKLIDAEKALKADIKVKVRSLPQHIPVLGDRIAIGTRVYEVDTHALKLRVATVEAEHIHYYDFHPEGVAATYTLSNNRGVQSDLRSGFSNIEHFLDKQQAEARLHELAEQRITELQNILKE